MTPRVLHVIPALWSGAGGVVTRLCRAQRHWGDVALATSSRWCGAAADWPSYRKQLSADGVRHHRIDFLDRDAAVFWQSVGAVTKLIEQWRPAVVHAHAGVPSAGVSIARDRGDVPFRFVAHLPAPAAVARAITGLLREPARMGAVAKRARRLVHRRYGWSQTVDRIEALYAVRPGLGERRAA